MRGICIVSSSSVYKCISSGLVQRDFCPKVWAIYGSTVEIEMFLRYGVDGRLSIITCIPLPPVAVLFFYISPSIIFLKTSQAR